MGEWLRTSLRALFEILARDQVLGVPIDRSALRKLSTSISRDSMTLRGAFFGRS